MRFAQRVDQLAHLGLGVSAEYGAAEATGSLDVFELRSRHPEFAQFLEIGVETHSGLDPHARRWLAAEHPATYHFLDINLDDPDDFDAAWLDDVGALVEQVRPAWLCGDAGMWHFGGRDPGQTLLLPPILCEASADAIADGILRLAAAVGHEVLPENPPGHVFLGDLHLLDFFGRVCERADCGMLLDCAHLAIFQRQGHHAPLTALDGFPLERIVEMHVAGGTEKTFDGWTYVEDDHTTAVLDATWEIFEHLVPRCPNLRAVVFECERNPVPSTLDGFARIARTLESAGR